MKLEFCLSRAKEYLHKMFLSEDDNLPPLCQLLKPLNRLLLDSQAFQFAPAAKSHHHNYPGGLIIHTAEVVYSALEIYDKLTFQHDDEDDNFAIIAIAALWHDVAKMDEYNLEGRKEDGDWDYSTTDYKDLVGHVTGSYGALMYALGSQGILLEGETLTHLTHAMLAHHDRTEWGSPKEPLTILAHCVHMGDVLSCQLGYVSEGVESKFVLYDPEAEDEDEDDEDNDDDELHFVEN